MEKLKKFWKKNSNWPLKCLTPAHQFGAFQVGAVDERKFVRLSVRLSRVQGFCVCGVRQLVVRLLGNLGTEESKLASRKEKAVERQTQHSAKMYTVLLWKLLGFKLQIAKSQTAVRKSNTR